MSLRNAKFGGDTMRSWLKEIRLEKGLTMKSIASEIGISDCYYSQIENGVRNVPVKTAKKIAALLGFDWQKFFE